METAIREMTRRIIEQFNPIKIVLFGSHARGTATLWAQYYIPL